MRKPRPFGAPEGDDAGEAPSPCGGRTGELARVERGAAALAHDLAALSPADPDLGRRLKETARKLRLASRELAALEWLVAEVEAGRLDRGPAGKGGACLPSPVVR